MQFEANLNGFEGTPDFLPQYRQEWGPPETLDLLDGPPKEEQVFGFDMAAMWDTEWGVDEQGRAWLMKLREMEGADPGEMPYVAEEPNYLAKLRYFKTLSDRLGVDIAEQRPYRLSDDLIIRISRYVPNAVDSGYYRMLKEQSTPELAEKMRKKASALCAYNYFLNRRGDNVQFVYTSGGDPVVIDYAISDPFVFSYESRNNPHLMNAQTECDNNINYFTWLHGLDNEQVDMDSVYEMISLIEDISDEEIKEACKDLPEVYGEYTNYRTRTIEALKWRRDNVREIFSLLPEGYKFGEIVGDHM